MTDAHAAKLAWIWRKANRRHQFESRLRKLETAVDKLEQRISDLPERADETEGHDEM